MRRSYPHLPSDDQRWVQVTIDDEGKGRQVYVFQNATAQWLDDIHKLFTVGLAGPRTLMELWRVPEPEPFELDELACNND